MGWCWDDDMPVLTPLLYGKKNIFIRVFSEVLHGLGIRLVFGGQARCPQNGVLLAGRTRQLADVCIRWWKRVIIYVPKPCFISGSPYRKTIRFKKRSYVLHWAVDRAVGYDPEIYSGRWSGSYIITWHRNLRLLFWDTLIVMRLFFTSLYFFTDSRSWRYAEKTYEEGKSLRKRKS